ncbi:MAG: ABC transporter ATP-binding protein [Lentisphaerae bacterium]|nr:ABC transporter ATP-binding protein [Lentisphaerota bacterium]
MIRFEQVTKRFGSRRVLDDISFEIRQGEVFVIVGPSGTGKSVTLKHMVRLLTPTSGRVWVGDTVASEVSGGRLERLRERFGYLFQGGALLAWMDVFENVALPLREKTDLDEDAIRTKVQQTLAMVGLETDGQKRPSEISGGMQKRAGLARAIVRDPEIVLYDEPTSGLDPVTARMIDQLIARLNRQIGITSVVVTHDLHSALSIGDRIAMLKDGRVAELSSPAEFRRSRNPVVREFLDAQYITPETQDGGF